MDDFTKMILRGAALPTAIAGAAAAIIAGATLGSPAAVGALLGTVVVVIFFTVGQLILAWVLKHNPMMGMSVAMLLYIVKIGVLLGLLLLLVDVTAFNTKAFAMTVLLCTLVWTAAEVWLFSRTKVLYVEPDNVPAALKQPGMQRSDVD